MRPTKRSLSNRLDELASKVAPRPRTVSEKIGAALWHIAQRDIERGRLHEDDLKPKEYYIQKVRKWMIERGRDPDEVHEHLTPPKEGE